MKKYTFMRILQVCDSDEVNKTDEHQCVTWYP